MPAPDPVRPPPRPEWAAPARHPGPFGTGSRRRPRAGPSGTTACEAKQRGTASAKCKTDRDTFLALGNPAGARAGGLRI